MTIGIKYLFASQFMPYHSTAIGLPWTEVEPGFQYVILVLMKVVGGTFMALAIASIMILIMPFRKGERWAHYTVPFMGIFCAGASLYATLFLRMKTGASTPWLAAGIPVIIYMAGMIVTYKDMGEKSNKSL
ncbi:MAG: hypothetical protein GQ556_00625 [Desulfobacterales bacterium]|nr:hypothetical protein [Desulfobacterales bacterium]